MSTPLTIPYQKVLNGVHIRMGGSVSNLQTDIAAAITEYVNSAYKLAWRHYEWPDVVEVEARSTDADGLVAYQQDGDTAIETFLMVTQNDPRTDRNPKEIGFRLHKGGAYLGPDWFSQTVYVTYRPKAPEFTSTPWGDGGSYSYAIGDLVYWASGDGNVYRCVGTATLEAHAPSDDSYWEVVPFLDLFAEAVKAGAYAAMTREDGQAPIAEIIRAEMEDLLLREIERLELQSGSYRTIRVGMDGY